MMKKLWQVLFDFFFPPRCIFCRKPLKSEGICEECLKELPFVKSKIKSPQFVTKTCAPLYYEGNVRASIIRYKFYGKTAYVEHFARLMHTVIKEQIKDHIDYITWVPLGAKKLKRRGYDQAHLIAKELSTLMNVPVVQTLKKVRNNKSQHKLKSVSARRANVVGVYEITSRADVWNKNILLVDDILTTGSTIFECTRQLKIAGAINVFAATIAKTPQKTKKQLKKAKNSL